MFPLPVNSNLTPVACTLHFLQISGNSWKLREDPVKVLLSSVKHYWPLASVPGIREMVVPVRRGPPGRPPGMAALRVGSSSVMLINNSAHGNLSAAFEVLEGIAGTEVYLRTARMLTLLHVPKPPSPCLTQPLACTKRGFTLAFFWRVITEETSPLSSPGSGADNTVEQVTRPVPGGALLAGALTAVFGSSGGQTEVRTQSGEHWLVSLPPLGHGWVHLLFTWRPDQGLKAYVNGSFVASDMTPSLMACYPDGEPPKKSDDSSEQLVLAPVPGDELAGAPSGPLFDEVVLWEYALTSRDVGLYLAAITGTAKTAELIATKFWMGTPGTPWSKIGHIVFPIFFPIFPIFPNFPVFPNTMETRTGRPLGPNMPGKRRGVFGLLSRIRFEWPRGAVAGVPGQLQSERFELLSKGMNQQEKQDGLKTGSRNGVALTGRPGHLQSSNARSTSPQLGTDTASNLSKALLDSVEGILTAQHPVQQSQGKPTSGIIVMVEEALGGMASQLLSPANSIVHIWGTTSTAEYALVKVPVGLSLPEYRFPSQGQSYIFLPGSAFPQHVELTIVGLLYHNLHHFYRYIRPAATRLTGADTTGEPLEVISPIITLRVDPAPRLASHLSGAPLVSVVLQHSKEIVSNNDSVTVRVWCAFLIFSGGQGVWSDSGCMREQGNRSHSSCKCNHLTNFAILMQVISLELSERHRKALSTISLVGCAVSLLCLSFTIATFLFLFSASSLHSERYLIHGNLSLALLLAEGTLLAGSHLSPGTMGCKLLAMLLHYLYLATFAWMLVEGLHLYHMVVRVFGSEDSHRLLYHALGWGAPLLLCMVSIAASFTNYGRVDNCWLSISGGAIWAFVAPALCVIAVNIVILIVVTRIISRISSENYRSHGELRSFRLTAKAVAVLMPILGISWLFGVLAVNESTILFQYLFALFNSMQGVFIFLFHCLLNSEVRAAFKHKTKVWSLSSSMVRPLRHMHSDAGIGKCNGLRNLPMESRLSPVLGRRPEPFEHSGGGLNLNLT
uniref:adhesion G-protein coupled receptor D1-like n=1 Tax=Myxine glutinosa TaxID=7769 RepID=UPI00358FEB7F